MSNHQKTENPTGAGKKAGLRMVFDSRLKLEFHGSKITSDAGLLAYRELDAALGLTDLGENLLSDGRTGKNTQHSMVAQMRQSIFSRLAGYEDTNDAERLAVDAAGGGIYTSTNAGVTWTLTSAPNNVWYSVASSADGTKLVAAAGGFDFEGPIYFSTDSGITWNQAIAPNTNWYLVASSAGGGKLVAVVSGGGIWTSQTTLSPQLNLTSSNTNLALSWTIPSTNFVLQQSFDLSSWSDVTDAPVLNLTNLQNEVFLSPTGGSGFYRLKMP